LTKEREVKMSEVSNLKSQIAQVDQKVQALRSALTKVQGVDLNVDDVMEGYEKLHVFGTKYDEQRLQESKVIVDGKEDLDKTYKQATIDAINAEIIRLDAVRRSLDTQLTDAIAREEYEKMDRKKSRR
jgi:hypothetical protein